MQAQDRLIVALDVSSLDEARSIVEELSGSVGMFKIGLELFTACGTEVFQFIESYQNVRFFFDGKYHDIPNTVAAACRNTTRTNVGMFNIHAQGGIEMMSAAAKATREEAAAKNIEKPILIAVTVLTSISENILHEQIKTSKDLDLANYVVHLAKMTQEAGLDGVVASPREVPLIREACGNDFVIVTPGIRPNWPELGKDDQKRVLTPAEAIAQGSTYLVIGRPITRAENRMAAVKRLCGELISH
ncbi:MAG: orotidine-5'-phosphate decarboxylase [Candidatus Melainabacteria bacterium]|nr:orotidine-5'-phosphate decarboxylase [Candidatus Melainabacteria bacterium]